MQNVWQIQPNFAALKTVHSVNSLLSFCDFDELLRVRNRKSISKYLWTAKQRRCREWGSLDWAAKRSRTFAVGRHKLTMIVSLWRRRIQRLISSTVYSSDSTAVISRSNFTWTTYFYTLRNKTYRIVLGSDQGFVIWPVLDHIDTSMCCISRSAYTFG